MAITAQEEKQNRKFYVPIRQGNRGGWSLFEWKSVREMPYRDREMYLGNSAVIGVLDKGGKWRKRDWYLQTGKRYDDPELNSEQKQAMQRDQNRINSALGITEFEDDEKLTQQEMQALLKKIKNKDGKQADFQEAVGLGFDKTKIQIRAKPTAKIIEASQLPGINQLDDDSGGRERSRQKKHKKDKKKKSKSKHHKDRDEQRHRSRSVSEHKKHKNRQRSVSEHKQHKKSKKHKKERKHRDD